MPLITFESKPGSDDTFRFDRGVLPRVLFAGIARDPAGTTYRDHTLEALEINFITGGAAEGPLNGVPHRPSAGNAYLYRPGDTFGGGVAHGVGHFVCRWVKFNWPVGDGVECFTLPREIALSPESQRAAQLQFDALLDAHAGGQSGWELLAGGHLAALVGVLVREAGRSGRSSGNAALDRRLAAACAYMEQHFARRLKVGDIAASARLAEDYFARLFRRRLGVSPLQYLIALRIREGRRLLAQNPGLTIREASRRAGFDDARHFARSFRKQFGMTPDEFRRRLESPYTA